MSTLPNATDVLNFWFNELEPKDWFVSSSELDKTITSRFGDLLKSAAQSELFTWRDSPQGRLAEVIVLDQFSRNIYRNTPKAFAQDPLALALAQEAISLGLDQELETKQRSFLYMPFMHSESAIIHQQAVELFNVVGMENNHEFELKHKVIIDRFGRYPHRNDILGRASSPEEVEFLTQPGSSF
ncbi:DUF924 domain-containing protein [Vibrio tubiashii]|uniref:DUF924 family protein n=1 Tax=Vibrio tubiashii TaxID=29498 RepID=UPI001EFC3F8C|nr:DUF924 family protein [Vibrio tubiashii]MCG9580424.1 DUF924 domain-containing protein [Vibrio tubiashii]MCG9614015.1 DUF924 domain-containing protein [Vibrio tubiashii]MCG9688387.1 DUF924 domain-containing protein [Vibrio tubiashii]